MRDRLRKQLPEYMVPDQWTVLEAFPLNANGKVDRSALERMAPLVGGEPAEEDAEQPPAASAPQGETESALAAIWRELFKLDRVGRHDDFFDLGGHSLLASRMVARVRASLGVQVSLVDVFDNPTVAGVAALIEAPEPCPVPPLAEAASTRCGVASRARARPAPRALRRTARFPRLRNKLYDRPSLSHTRRSSLGWALAFGRQRSIHPTSARWH